MNEPGQDKQLAKAYLDAITRGGGDRGRSGRRLAARPHRARHRGKEAIGRFWDTVIEPGQLETHIRESYPAGDECANVATFIAHFPGGLKIPTDLVTVYRVDEREDRLPQGILGYLEERRTARGRAGRKVNAIRRTP